MAAVIVQQMKDATMPQVEIKKRGRRPNLSTQKAAAMEDPRSRIVFPAVSYSRLSVCRSSEVLSQVCLTYSKLLVLFLNTGTDEDDVHVV